MSRTGRLMLKLFAGLGLLTSGVIALASSLFVLWGMHMAHGFYEGIAGQPPYPSDVLTKSRNQ